MAGAEIVFYDVDAQPQEAVGGSDLSLDDLIRRRPERPVPEAWSSKPMPSQQHEAALEERRRCESARAQQLSRIELQQQRPKTPAAREADELLRSLAEASDSLDEQLSDKKAGPVEERPSTAMRWLEQPKEAWEERPRTALSRAAGDLLRSLREADDEFERALQQKIELPSRVVRDEDDDSDMDLSSVEDADEWKPCLPHVRPPSPTRVEPVAAPRVSLRRAEGGLAQPSRRPQTAPAVQEELLIEPEVIASSGLAEAIQQSDVQPDVRGATWPQNPLHRSHTLDIPLIPRQRRDLAPLKAPLTKHRPITMEQLNKVYSMSTAASPFQPPGRPSRPPKPPRSGAYPELSRSDRSEAWPRTPGTPSEARSARSTGLLPEMPESARIRSLNPSASPSPGPERSRSTPRLDAGCYSSSSSRRTTPRRQGSGELAHPLQRVSASLMRSCPSI